MEVKIKFYDQKYNLSGKNSRIVRQQAPSAAPAGKFRVRQQNSLPGTRGPEMLEMQNI